ncbi:MAG: hypothetical protein ACI85F_000640 [Bacteroidia bacterium]|jgi:hypothetical protein
MKQPVKPITSAQNLLARGGIKWVELMGSTFIFAAVYLLVYVSYDLTTALAAKHFGMEPILFFDRIQYMNPSETWYPHAVKRTFLSGSLLMVLLASFSYLIYLAVSKTYIYIRLFLLWTSLISVAILSQRMLSIPFDGRYELGIFSAYMYYEQSTNYAFAFIGFVLLIVAGLIFTKPFLQTASSATQVANDGNRTRFVLYQVLLPMLAGAGIAIIVPFPENIVPNAIAFLCCAIILAIVFFRSLAMGPVKIPKQSHWERWPIVPSVLLGLTLILYRVVLSLGLRIPDPNVFF